MNLAWGRLQSISQDVFTQDMTVIIPSTGRPDKLRRTLNSIPNHIPVALHCRWESDLPDGCHPFSASFGLENVVQSFNFLAERTLGDVIAVCDDVVFKPDFFDNLAEFASSNPHLEVIGTRSLSLNHPSASFSLVRRSFINRRGFLFHPDFEHFYVDNELEMAARSIGVFGFCEKALLTHFHPSFSKEYDATHSSGRREKHTRDTATWNRVRHLPVKWKDTVSGSAPTV